VTLGNRGSGFDTGWLLKDFLFSLVGGENSLIGKTFLSFAKIASTVHKTDDCAGTRVRTRDFFKSSNLCNEKICLAVNLPYSMYISGMF